VNQLRFELDLFQRTSKANVLSDKEIAKKAEWFAHELPHAKPPYSKRNWGGVGHSICSYQGKLKPSIGYFLIDQFTSPNSVVYDPLGGVGTIPFEARKQGRIGIASDLSPLAASVCASKLERIDPSSINLTLAELEAWISSFTSEQFNEIDITFGLNGSIADYFHEQTLFEVVAARSYFKSKRLLGLNTSENLILTSIMHILHGNRPYALSRNSHPITPFKPSGEAVYKNLITFLNKRLQAVVPYFLELQQEALDGKAYLGSFEDIELELQVDTIITSPPFVDSFRFWSSNWMRIWMAGWEPQDFQSRPKEFLDTKQKSSMNEYVSFSNHMSRHLKENGLLILHLGVTKNRNMASEIAELITNNFKLIKIVQEDVARTESHGLTDKGKKTIEHAYLFARKI
jgi:hypothetical protein